MMKILVVSHDKRLIGGANRSLLMVLTSLKNRYNAEIDVILPGENGSLEPELKKAGFNCIICNFQCAFSVLKGEWKDFLRKIQVHFKYFKEVLIAHKIADSIKNNKYDMVYTNTRYPVMGAVIAEKLNIPHVCHIREFDTAYQGRWTYKSIYKRSDKVILISQALHNRMTEDTPSDKLVMIHNGISGNIGLEKHDLFPDNRFNMLITGRIVSDKGQEDAIRALHKLVDEGYSGMHLYMAGSAPDNDLSYEEKLKALIQEFSLDTHVTFLGEVTDMKKIRDEMDIELMCSVCETFGRVTVEGMRNGLLLIGSNTGGTIEIIDDGVTGYLYEQGNSDSLANVLKNVYNNRESAAQIADNGYNMSQINFTEEKNVEQIYDVFCKVCKNN